MVGLRSLKAIIYFIKQIAFASIWAKKNKKICKKNRIFMKFSFVFVSSDFIEILFCWQCYGVSKFIIWSDKLNIIFNIHTSNDSKFVSNVNNSWMWICRLDAPKNDILATLYFNCFIFVFVLQMVPRTYVSRFFTFYLHELLNSFTMYNNFSDSTNLLFFCFCKIW